MDYSASMVSCLFWLQETRKTAELMHDGLTLQEIREKAVSDNIVSVLNTDEVLQYNQRIAQACDLLILPDSNKDISLLLE